jgi:RNA polymerase sigma-70 factor (ECF subfamily)
METALMGTVSGALMAEASSAQSDEQLVARTLDGEVGAFNDLVTRWEDPLYRFVYRYLGDAEDARDICQEAFVRAYTNLNGFRGQSKFSSWLYQIALNLSRSEFRKRGSRPTVSLDDEEAESHLRLVQNEVAGPDEWAIHGQRAHALQQALAALPERQRTVVILKEYHGLKFREIAEILDTPESTVKSRLYHGLESLARSLGHLRDEGL